MDPLYRVVRVYMHKPGRKTTLARDLTLEQAQNMTQDPEASYSTATSKTARARTRRVGPWFDCYYRQE